MANQANNTTANRSGTPTEQSQELNFRLEVEQATQPILVAFLTPWSRPCQAMDSVLEELASALKGNVKVFRINADDRLDLSLCYDIQSVPTLLYFVDGRPCLRIVGTATKEAILARLRTSTTTESNR